MRPEATTTDIGASLKSFSSADVFFRPVSAIRQGALRLEAGFYGSDGYRAAESLRNSGFDLRQTGATAGVTWFGPFSRTYVDDATRGLPFLSSSEMLAARLEPKNFLSKVLTPRIERLKVKRGTILISCSGTIGNIAICTRDYDGATVSQHAIRVVAEDVNTAALLYLLFLSDLGQFLLTRSKSGSVIESIYQADVESVPVPRLPVRLLEHFAEVVAGAMRRRENSASLLRQADALLLKIIPKGLKFQGPSRRPTATFVHSAAVLQQARIDQGYVRLDATHYDPESLKMVNSLREGGAVALRTLADRVVLIGKTFVGGVHKVERGNGVPYFTGKELFTTRPTPETFITSNRKALIDRLLVKRGTVLVTCAGTVGRVMYVRDLFEGAAITHDAIRIIPGDDLHPGFIYGCLTSPIGRVQMERCVYGSVIPRLYRTHVENVLIPKPKDGGKEVGSLVDAAFDERANAYELENDAIALLLKSLQVGRLATERKWGKEYLAI